MAKRLPTAVGEPRPSGTDGRRAQRLAVPAWPSCALPFETLDCDARVKNETVSDSGSTEQPPGNSDAGTTFGHGVTRSQEGATPLESASPQSRGKVLEPPGFSVRLRGSRGQVRSCPPAQPAKNHLLGIEDTARRRLDGVGAPAVGSSAGPQLPSSAAQPSFHTPAPRLSAWLALPGDPEVGTWKLRLPRMRVSGRTGG